MTRIDSDQRRPLPELRLHDIRQMHARMQFTGMELEASNPSDEEIIEGAGNTGTIVTSADLAVSDFLLAYARKSFPGSFSEEDDPVDQEGNHIRLKPDFVSQGYFIIDPIDGTGDRRYGTTGSPERKGYSVLATFMKDGNVSASLVERPAYQQEIIYIDGQIIVIENGKARKLEHPTRTDSQNETVRVNVRKAYEGVNFPPDFWKFAYEVTGTRFEEVRSGGAGDSLSKLVLGDVDLVVARKGDWKVWDTGPFDPMVKLLGGKMTDCDNNPLGGYLRNDLWHRNGVVASLGISRGHDNLIIAMEQYKQNIGNDLVIRTSPK